MDAFSALVVACGDPRRVRGAAIVASIALLGPWAVAADALVPLSNVAAIGAGGQHSCALTATGGVKCWGGNGNGSLGDGTYTLQRPFAADVNGLASGVTVMTVGLYHSCALTTGGGVKCWGNNGNGQLGDNSTTQRREPVDVSGLASGATAVTAGYYHSCALTTAGGVKCWGYNGNGQLGDDTTGQKLVPVDVSGLTSGVTAIDAGAYHTCALTTGGGVKCWGANNYGQLGDNTTSQSLVPVDAVGLASGVAAITTGGNHSCVRTTLGGAKCWGANYTGQLGDGTATQRNQAVDVSGLGSGVAAIEGGYNFTCAVLAGGAAKCWGYNDLGPLGDGSNASRLAPVDVTGLAGGVAAISGGGSHSCAVVSGGVQCWGSNDNGQLGDGTDDAVRVTPVTVGGLGSGIAGVAGGSGRTCAITAGGGLKCLGANGSGQIGDGTRTHAPTAVDVSGLASGVAAVALGGNHTCARTTGGGVKCWGNNNTGQLGDNSFTSRTVPVDVSGFAAGALAIAAGGGHSCAIVTGGGVKCWGSNGNGQLGDNSTTQKSVPTDVSGLGSGVLAITAGSQHTCALTSVGGVKCWGNNANGQLGDDTTAQKLTPVDVSGLTNGVLAIAAGDAHTCAQTAGGGLKCWGHNDYGQLGDDTYTQRPAPVDVNGLLSDVVAVDGGNMHSCALTSGGGVKCWGAAWKGQVGDGSLVRDRRVPVDVTGLASGATAIATGSSHSCALVSGGAIKCWGDNVYGQTTGDGKVGFRTSPTAVLTQGSAAPPNVVTIRSRKAHGGAGSYDLLLAATPSDPTTEPRWGGAGGSHTVVFVFDTAVNSGSAAVTAGVGTAGSPTFSGVEMTVPLSGVNNAQYVTVTVTNVASDDGGTGGGGSVRVGFLAGDVNATRSVTLSDMLRVNAVLAQLVSESNYLRDVNASGTLTLSDLLLVNARLTQTLPTP